jgi:hypothetical protein
MKKALTFLVTALIPVLAATMAPSCAGGESVSSGSGGSGENGTGGSGDNGTGGSSSSSGGKVGSGGSNSSSGGSNSSSGGSSSSSGGKVGSGGSNSSSGGSNSSSGGSTGSGGSTTGSGGGTATGTGGTTGACATDATMTVMNGLATSGTWTGYAYTYAGSAPATVSPVCGTTGTCFMTAAKQLCVSGSVGPDTTYNASAGFGWNIGGTTATPAAIAPGGSGLAYNVQGLTTVMRFQIEDGAAVQYCANVTAAPSGTIPWAMFKQKCYDATPGAAYAPTTPIAKVGIVVPSDSGTARAFCFCVLSLGAAP